jgi:opacity protein-like surface antigen
MCKKILFVTLFLFSFSSISFSQQGKLDKGKKSLKDQKSTGNSGKRTSKSSRSTRNDPPIENPLARILWFAAAYTAYGLAIESPWEFNGNMHDAEISNYTYKEHRYGNFIYTDSMNYKIARFDITNNFVREGNNLYGNNLGVNFRFLKRFALEVEYLYLSENVNNTTDNFSMYSALLKYYRIRTQRFDAWFGLGVVHVGSNVDKTGFGLGFGAELFVAKPISIDFSHKWTSINQQEVHKTKLLLKYHIKNYHISSGYEHFKIGVSKIKAFSIGVGASF